MPDDTPALATVPAPAAPEAAREATPAGTEPPTYAELMAERVKLRRQVRALKGGSAWLEKAGEVCARMGMKSAEIEGSVHHARRRFLPDRYHAMPLCDIERTLIRQGMNALVVCIVYEVTATAIMRQLDAMQREMRDDPRAVERYGRSPPLILGTPACWPVQDAGRP